MPRDPKGVDGGDGLGSVLDLEALQISEQRVLAIFANGLPASTPDISLCRYISTLVLAQYAPLPWLCPLHCFK